MKSLFHVSTAAAALCFPATAWSQTAPQERIDEIVVTANRTAQPLSRVGQSVTLIDEAQIVQRQAATVTDMLREVPGVSFASNGGIGSVTTVFIRGAESEQTVALIDGVKLNDPSSPGGGFYFGNLLIGNIARIEVLRGPSSVLWGSQAIGGVINMITRPPGDALAVNARAEGGTRETGQGVVNVSGRVGTLSASVGGGYFRTQGISAFSEARGGRERDGYRNTSANAAFNLALDEKLSVDLRGFYSNARAEQDGFAAPTYAFGDTADYSRTRETVGYGGINLALLDGRLRNRLGYAYTDTRRRNIDPAGGVQTQVFAGDGSNERLEYQGVFDASQNVQATFGLEREISRFDTSSSGGPVTSGRARIASGYGQLVVSPAKGLTLTAGLRHDDHDRFGGATTLGASGVFSPNDGATTVRASYSEGFKAPSLYQLQGDYGNQLLRPERSRGYDAGIVQKLLDGAVEAGVTWFHRDSRDLIVFVSCPQPGTGICADRPWGTYDNVARARGQGAEISLALRPLDVLTARIGYSLIDARDRSAGSANYDRRLARRPSQIVNAAIDYRWPIGLETGATLTHVGDSFDNASNSRKLDGYVLAAVRASFDISRAVTLYGRIENLLDEEYETAFQYGTPGRAGYAGVRLRY